MLYNPPFSSPRLSRLAAYNPRTDTLFISRAILDSQKVIEAQKNFACGENQLSTFVHELIHWKDASDYRKKYGDIISSTRGSAYTVYQNKNAREALLKEGIDLTSPNEIRKDISKYASDCLLDNNYEEVYTEFRTKRLLKG